MYIILVMHSPSVYCLEKEPSSHYTIIYVYCPCQCSMPPDVTVINAKGTGTQS